jgi:DNA ligase D-like protein (predicted 3'-phosphoesterase)
MISLYQRDIPDQFTLWPDSEPYLRFVIKLHQASTLHYDFRLEAFGVLFSWVLPMHPSHGPSQCLWACQVGDHNPKYLLTERRIPEGQYGAGPMLVWDHGFHRPLCQGTGSHSFAICDALRRGRLDLELFGKRVRGDYRLQRSGTDWRLRKLRDEFAQEGERFFDDRSIISGRSLAQIR